MSGNIHPTAVIDPKAELASDVEVGAYAVIGPQAKIGSGTKIWHHASIWGNTSIGKDCQIFPFASIGMQTQDLKFKGGNPGVKIGDRNVFREYVSINAATNDGDFTEIGNDNLLLAYGHVGHCCKLGNNIIASNGVAFAGHVVVEDHAGIGGGGTGIHQFCHVGRHCFIGGCSKVEQDVPPFMLADGNPAKIRMFNKVGLERAGYTPEQMSAIKFIFRTFYRQGLNRQQAIEAIKSSSFADTQEAKSYIAFAESSERGLAGGNK
ncbi:acyl-ACP--UDP-N-acetylglucosamine O-acyltransferase [Pelagicoccus albus]|uniref:Acyl-ACP--UDP-N-acetylglucosamine O-acyltransferase n=1 Tax=Pelagicoccus albus TaxID=415222 RepID=A0A7X1B9M2_9BACT|nr:acyl-ACP--UDP-N-acetylglucosamine O-acyltransferase [Pelagicoccus albus]MBC2608213.1 acyl-ACP--UDP-N-acetylglucosamine O-acyltransferase [Pelagicoccus albus]